MVSDAVRTSVRDGRRAGLIDYRRQGGRLFAAAAPRRVFSPRSVLSRIPSRRRRQPRRDPNAVAASASFHTERLDEPNTWPAFLSILVMYPSVLPRERQTSPGRRYFFPSFLITLSEFLHISDLLSSYETSKNRVLQLRFNYNLVFIE